MIRPLWMVFPDCPFADASDVEDDHNDRIFMVGDALLVAPVLEPEQKELKIPLPITVRHFGGYEFCHRN